MVQEKRKEKRKRNLKSISWRVFRFFFACSASNVRNCSLKRKVRKKREKKKKKERKKKKEKRKKEKEKRKKKKNMLCISVESSEEESCLFGRQAIFTVDELEKVMAGENRET